MNQQNSKKSLQAATGLLTLIFPLIGLPIIWFSKIFGQFGKIMLSILGVPILICQIAIAITIISITNNHFDLGVAAMSQKNWQEAINQFIQIKKNNAHFKAAQDSIQKADLMLAKQRMELKRQQAEELKKYDVRWETIQPGMKKMQGVIQYAYEGHTLKLWVNSYVWYSSQEFEKKQFLMDVARFWKNASIASGFGQDVSISVLIKDQQETIVGTWDEFWGPKVKK